MDSLIRGLEGLGFRRTHGSPEVYPSAPNGHKHREPRGRRGGQDGSSDVVIRVHGPYGVDLPSPIDITPVGIEQTEERIKTEGTDALAWYAPFHFYDNDHWGIFVRLTGIEYLARVLLVPASAPELRQTNLDGKVRGARAVESTLNIGVLRKVAFAVLFYHEYFHFLTEVGSTVPETVGGKSGPPYYERYARDVYSKPVNPDEPLEEALANAYAFNQLQRPPTVVRKVDEPNSEALWDPYALALGNFMANQPMGYRSYSDFIKERFSGGLNRLGMEVSDGSSSLGNDPPLGLMFGHGSSMMVGTRVPVRFVE